MSPRSAARPDVPVLVCCASRDRPDCLLRAARSFAATSTLADMVVYIDSDQNTLYLHHTDWTAEFGDRVRFLIQDRVGPNASINRLFERYRDDGYRIFGVVPDDSIFQREGWDEYVIEQFDRFPGGIGVISPAHSDGDYCAYPYVGRKWLDIVGYYAMPEAHSFVWDTCIEMLGEATNIIYAPADKFYMWHEAKASENFDTYLQMDTHKFLSWCVVARRAIVKRLRHEIVAALHPPGSGERQPLGSVCRTCGALQQ